MAAPAGSEPAIILRHDPLIPATRFHRRRNRTYFRSTSDQPTPRVPEIDGFAYSGSADLKFMCGLRPTLPFRPLLAASHGLGHTNYLDEMTIPSCIAVGDSSGRELVVSFPFEV